MRVAWTRTALAELDNMLAYIAAEDATAARAVAARVLKAEETVLHLPKAGRYDVQTDTYDRFIPKTRIVLAYAVREDTIWMLTVWHTSRAPETTPQRS